MDTTMKKFKSLIALVVLMALACSAAAKIYGRLPERNKAQTETDDSRDPTSAEMWPHETCRFGAPSEEDFFCMSGLARKERHR